MSDYKTIFILFSCNEWKEYHSMRFIAAATSIEDIYATINVEIRHGNMDYNGSTKHIGAKLFSEALKCNGFNLSLLDYGYVMECENLVTAKKKRNHNHERR